MKVVGYVGPESMLRVCFNWFHNVGAVLYKYVGTQKLTWRESRHHGFITALDLKVWHPRNQVFTLS